jgi:predicted ATPase
LDQAAECVCFDRCPADVLAYLLVGGHSIEAHIERAREAMSVLDLVVIVPIEEPDRIVVSPHENEEQRRAVDEELYQLLVDEQLAEEVLVVRGDLRTRVAQVLARIDDPDAPTND